MSWKVFLWYQIAFFSKKIFFFLQNFRDFWVFLKFRSMVAKSENGKWFFRRHLYWPWVCIRREMENLFAKTPCVLSDSIDEGGMDFRAANSFVNRGDLNFVCKNLSISSDTLAGWAYLFWIGSSESLRALAQSFWNNTMNHFN